MSSTYINELAAHLQQANYAYHNTDTLLMSDDEYDRSIEELRRLSPSHPFLSLIGAAPSAKGNVVVLPYTMASLDKIRYGEGGLARWVKRIGQSKAKYTITEKLDGLSALYIYQGPANQGQGNERQGKHKLYLRGDGVKGVDVSFACEPLGLTTKSFPTSIAIRGEILLANEATPPGSIGRSLVNGWLHRKAIQELHQCHFVAYQIHEPVNMKRQEQLEWLSKNGFRIPQHALFSQNQMTEDSLKELLVNWRNNSTYPLDGIVIGLDNIPIAPKGGEVSNPDDAVAFKAALDEQRAETRVIEVEWNVSRQNIWVPRIQIEPVLIGGARIQWLSGHNAAAIEEGGIGPGAHIQIRRSGDVIPTLEKVIQKAPHGPQMPSPGTWDWDARHVQAVFTAASSSPLNQQVEQDMAVKGILHGLSTLGVDGIGPGLVKKMVEEGGFQTMKSLYEAKEANLSACIGPGRGPAVLEGLHNAVQKASQVTLLIASNRLPRGVAEKKLRILYSLEADARQWNLDRFIKAKPAGWTEESLETLFQSLPNALQWIQDSFGSIQGQIQKNEVKNNNGQDTLDVKYVVFTGVRDKDLAARMSAKGWIMEDSITKKTNVLVIADDALGGPETTKMKKAKQLGVKIVTLTEFRKHF